MAKRHVIPDEVLETHIGILGKTGSGKTYTAKGLVERMLEQGRHVVVLDPTGVWWGLRTTAKGGAGFPVTIFGGDHQDIAIDGNSGAEVAAVVYSKGLSAVIDTLGMSVTQRTRFARDFMQEAFRRNREPTHLVIDECHLFMPQASRGVGGVETNEMVNAANTLVSGGRARGWRIMMLSQRAAKVNKDSLTQCETLVAHRVIHPLDRKAVADWIDGCGDPGKSKEVLGSLAGLKCGEAWVWSPENDVLNRSMMPRIGTADTSATPKHGERRITTTVAEIDLEAVQGMLKAAGEEAEANDPAKLKARVAELTKQLHAAHAAPVAMPEQVDEIVAKAKAEAADGWSRLLKGIGEAIADEIKLAHQLHERLESRAAQVRSLLTLMQGSVSEGLAEHKRSAARPTATPAPKRATRSVPINVVERGTLTGPQRRIVDALAWWASIGVAEPSRSQVGFVAGIKPAGGHFNNTIGPLATGGLIAYPKPGHIRLEPRGEAAAQCVVESVDLGQYHKGILNMVKTGPQRRMLEAMIALGSGAEISREELGERTDIKPSGGHFNNTIGPLSTLGLIEYPRPGLVRGTELLFPPALAAWAAA